MIEVGQIFVFTSSETLSHIEIIFHAFLFLYDLQRNFVQSAKEKSKEKKKDDSPGKVSIFFVWI